MFYLLSRHAEVEKQLIDEIDTVLGGELSYDRLKQLKYADAHVFRPERWLEMKERPSEFKFLSFNAGPRLCLGRSLAIMESKLLAASILQRYRLRLVDNRVDPYQVTLTFQMQNGMPVTVLPRSR